MPKTRFTTEIATPAWTGTLGTGLRRVSMIALGLSVSACGADLVEAPQAKPQESVEASLIKAAAPPMSIAAAAASAAAATGPVTLGFATYDGSGQVVHPDVVTFSEPWNGHRYWNALTPYPNSAIQFENPSLFSSDDGDQWGVPEGVINPLSRTSRGYLSDPDMIFEPKSGQLWLYYREVQNLAMPKGKTAHIADHVWLTRSSDAIHWSAAQRVATDSNKFVVSPSIVRTPEGGMSMYQIDAGQGGCSSRATKITRRRSNDGLVWTAPAAVTFAQQGFLPWHLDVQYIAARNEYWALVAAYNPARGCTTTSLFLATSTDGINFTTYPTPVLAAGETAAFGSAVYRSTFAYDATNGDVTIWYSGCRVVKPGAKKRPPVLAWSAAVTHTTATALMARVNDKTRTIKLTVAQTPGTTLTSTSNVP